MKAYFTRLFKYDGFVNEIILKTILKAGQPGQPISIMAHVVAAQQQWLGRCKGPAADAGTGIVLWPEWDLNTLTAAVTDSNKAYLDFIEGLNPSAFETAITYKNSKGESFENKLEDILAHVINHSTHHRAQVGQHLKSAGIDPLPNSDYINYIRYVYK